MRAVLLVAVPLALVIVVVVWAVAARKTHPAEETLESPIELCLLFSKPVGIDPDDLAARYSGEWKTRAVCKENPEWADREGRRAYGLKTDQGFAVLTARPEPLTHDLLMLTIASGTGLTASQKNDIEQHQACLTIAHIGGPKEPVEQARMATQMLLTASNLPGCIGYVSVSGQRYVPKETLDGVMTERELDESALFLLLGGMNCVDEEPGYWIHTHGMEQFGCPDLEVRYEQPSRQGYFENLISNGAIYMIDKGPIVKPGHTTEMAGDGIIYEIHAAKQQSGHNYGKYGALEIVPQAGHKKSGTP